MWRIRASFAKVRVVAPRGVRAGLDGRIVVHQGQDSLRPGDDFHVEVAGLGDGLGIVHTLFSLRNSYTALRSLGGGSPIATQAHQKTASTTWTGESGAGGTAGLCRG